MNYLEAVLLGITQGLTEFLPISSSGHLEIGKAIMGFEALGPKSLIVTIVLHLGTAFSTIVVFRKEIYEIVLDSFKLKKNENKLFSLKIFISMIPAILVGLFFKNKIENLFSMNLIFVGTMLLITAFLLFIADQTLKNKKEISYTSALILGIVQAVAILPGISRSGSTIAIAVLLGIDREKSARFSFLMVLPLIFGSMIKSFLDFGETLEVSNLSSLFIGFISSFLFGIIACRWMISIVKQSQLKYFGFYCIIVGGLTLFYGLF